MLGELRARLLYPLLSLLPRPLLSLQFARLFRLLLGPLLGPLLRLLPCRLLRSLLSEPPTVVLSR